MIIFISKIISAPSFEICLAKEKYVELIYLLKMEFNIQHAQDQQKGFLRKKSRASDY